MRSIRINNSKVFMGDNLINAFGDIISNLISPCKVLIITDNNVAKYYLDKVRINLTHLNFQVHTFIVKSGERSKSLSNIKKIYDILSINFMTRSDVILGLGGGVITDMSGFIASTYKRGMKLIYIPTSLLAQIDASIGGKNGIDSDYGKNIIGTFYNPDIILIDPETLYTLPSYEINSGIAEIIKYGCIKDKYIFENLLNNNFYSSMYDIIYKSVMVKKDIVEKDEFDLNIRMHLNFGHTIGHALELLGGYKILSHGQAVSIGMNIITNISENVGLTKKGTANKLNLVCQKYSLPTQTTISLDKILKIIKQDKKITNNNINFILIKEIGHSFIYNVSYDKILDLVKRSI